MNVSNRAQQLTPSVTLAAAAKAKALKAKGVDVLSLTVGEPDFVTPKNIQKAAIASIEDGIASYYTPSGGIPELKQAIVSYVEREYQLRYQPKQVIVTDGAKYALYLLFQAILNVGDEVIIPVPYWVSYGEQVKLAEGKPVFVSSTQEQSFKVSVAQLEAVRTDKTKAIILNSPSNPTGVIYTEEELRQIGEWAVAHNILIIADDIYGRLVYNGHRFTPIATISEAIRQQTIIINGVGDEKIIQAMTQLASQSTSNPVAVSQYAAIEALTGEQSTVEDMRQAFEKRLNHIYPKVAALPGVSLIKPEGAFYLFPNVKKTLEICGYDNVTNWVEDLLQEAHVALVTGEGFGAPEHVRMSYATDLMTLEKAIERMNDFIEKKRIQHNA